MAFNAHTFGATESSVNRFFGAFHRVWAKVSAVASHALQAVQVARMTSVLSDMTDKQLAEIGISRSGIPAYAERLIVGEQME
jgi:uncharacterized protein YjiS (DUF1127 family)